MILYAKVPAGDSLADIVTKGAADIALESLIKRSGCVHTVGRSDYKARAHAG